MNTIKILSYVMILIGLAFLPKRKEIELVSIQPSSQSYTLHSMIGILSIPKLNLQEAVVSGSDTTALDIGIGHIPNSGYTTSNMVLAAHRATYFKQLDKLDINDIIEFQDIEYQTHTYIVYDIFKVNPKDVWVTTQTKEDIVTLITCTDNNSKRLIIRARKEEITNE